MKSIISLMAAAAFSVATLVAPAFAAGQGHWSASRCRPRPRRAGSMTATHRQAARGPGLHGRPAIRRGRHPEPARQIENMITKGAKALIIAAIDGTTLSDALQKAADAGVMVIAYDRLISKTAQCRLLHHLRQFRRRRDPGEFAASRASRSASRTPRPVERRTVRRFAGRQQRLLLLQRRHVASCSR